MRPATAVPMARRKVLVPNVECSCEHNDVDGNGGEGRTSIRDLTILTSMTMLMARMLSIPEQGLP